MSKARRRRRMIALNRFAYRRPDSGWVPAYTKAWRLASRDLNEKWARRVATRGLLATEPVAQWRELWRPCGYMKASEHA